MGDIIINPYFFVAAASYDSDAQNYIDRVEAADGAALETTTKDAMNQLVLDLKDNSLWSSIYYCVPGCGPRTIEGGAELLQGGFSPVIATGDIRWDRKAGFAVNASSGANYMDGFLTGITESSAGTRSNASMSCWVESLGSGSCAYYAANRMRLNRSSTNNRLITRNRSGTDDAGADNSDVTGFRGTSRSGASNYTRRVNSADATVTRTDSVLQFNNFRLFLNHDGTGQAPINTGVSWHHFGTALSLSTLQAVVSDYRAAIAAAF